MHWSAVAAGLCYFLYILITQWRKKQRRVDFATTKGCQPPRNHLKSSLLLPLGLDKLQNVLKADRANRLPPFMLAEFEQHGHTYTQNAGGQYVVITREPENIAAVLSSQFKEFDLGADRRGNFRALAGEGVFTQEGHAWARSRQLLRPQFAKQHVCDLEALEPHVLKLVGRVRELRCDKGSSACQVDLQKLFFSLTLEYATEFLFGKSINAEEGSDSQKYSSTELSPAEAFEECLKWLARRGRVGDFYWLVGGLRFKRVCKALHGHLDSLVAQALRLREQRTSHQEKDPLEDKVFLNALLAQIDNPKAVRNHLLGILIAGRDTTASFLGWIFYVLARHPAILAKLRMEMSKTLGDDGSTKPPTHAQLMNMEYLTWVLDEVLRLYPTAPLNGRTATQDTTLPVGGGIDGQSPLFISKGTKVGYNIFALHRRRDFFGADADVFRPERWGEEPARSAKSLGWRFLPFNGGPRACLGQQMAFVEAAYVTCRLVQLCDCIEVAASAHKRFVENPFTAAEGEAETLYGLNDGVRYEVGLVMAPARGVWVDLSLRN